MKSQPPIPAGKLAHSKEACYRVEDMIWRHLAALDITVSSGAREVLAAMEAIREKAPAALCDKEAWLTMCDMFARRARTFGDLRLFQQLRYRKDER